MTLPRFDERLRVAATPRHRRTMATAVAMALGSCMIAAHGTAQPATGGSRGSAIPVTNCNDSGPGSLRDAVDGATDGAIIELNGLDCSTITLVSGAIYIDQDELTLKGDPDHRVTIRASRDDNPENLDRVISHYGTGELTVSELTISDGLVRRDGDALGGCIRSEGSVTLIDTRVENCVVTSRYGAAAGGGVFAAGNATLKYSEISGSTASAYDVGYDDPRKYTRAVGGGAFVYGDLLAKYSSIRGNEAKGFQSDYLIGVGGGVMVAGEAVLLGTSVVENQACVVAGLLASLFVTSSDDVSIVNSTISGNIASGFIGGLYFRRPAVVRNSTISDNVALGLVDPQASSSGNIPRAAAVFRAYDVEIQSSIFADNTSAGAATDLAVQKGSLSGANNLVQAPLTGPDLAPMPADTLVGIDPELLPLADWGGNHLLVHLPRNGSPLLDAGNLSGNDPPGSDQRELDRVVGAGPDIGAVERQGPLDGDVIFADGFELPLALPGRSP